MLENIKKVLHIGKIQLIYKKGVDNGDIVPFDDDLYDKMSHTYINCLPVSMHIKYLKSTFRPYKCYERSLFMFLCFKNAVLVHGKVDYIKELKKI